MYISNASLAETAELLLYFWLQIVSLGLRYYNPFLHMLAIRLNRLKWLRKLHLQLPI